jgi:hypothetical protein
MLDLTKKQTWRVAEPTDQMREIVLRKWREYGFK